MAPSRKLRGLVNHEKYSHGQKVPSPPLAPAQAVADGIGYVSEDRKLDGFFDTLGVGENIGLGWLAKFGRRKVLSPFGRMRQIAQEWEKRLSIRRIGADQPVLQLSGGNQQKVVIAKSLVKQPRLVIFDAPTRGVDVGAISESRSSAASPTVAPA